MSQRKILNLNEAHEGKRQPDPTFTRFCFPGQRWTEEFCKSWDQTWLDFMQQGKPFQVSRKGGSNVCNLRNQVAGGFNQAGKGQAAFQGKVDYDYMMWIDSDQVWTPAQVYQLMSHDRDIMSGVYVTADGFHTTICEKHDPEYFRKNGRWQKTNLQEIVEKRGGIFMAESVGFGFILIKRGVFEKLNYPWFTQVPEELPGGGIDIPSEDVSFCRKAFDAGFKIWVDPTVIVGHTKSVTLPKYGNSNTKITR